MSDLDDHRLSNKMPYSRKALITYTLPTHLSRISSRIINQFPNLLPAGVFTLSLIYKLWCLQLDLAPWKWVLFTLVVLLAVNHLICNSRYHALGREILWAMRRSLLPPLASEAVNNGERERLSSSTIIPFCIFAVSAGLTLILLGQYRTNKCSGSYSENITRHRTSWENLS